MEITKTQARDILKRREKKNLKTLCPVCGKPVEIKDDFEYVLTKHKTELFIHDKCVDKLWK